MIPTASPFVLLDDRSAGGCGARLYSDPTAVLTCHAPEDAAAALARIDAHLQAGGHAAGYLAYELGGVFEHRVSMQHCHGPLLQIGLFGPPQHLQAHALDAFLAERIPPPLTGLRPALGAAAYAERFDRLAEYIRAGDVYQVNLAFPLAFHFAGDPLALYAALRARQPVAHGAFVRLDEAAILSVSPELHVEITGGVAVTAPMKGTIARGADRASDDANRASLAADAKQRAENLMILDLLRNDLSRISEPGSVTVSDAFRVETYPTFHAMTSTVSARLAHGIPLAEMLAALFPCGSITGAPKVRAMEIIHELEDAPRGVYTGSIGAFGPGGDMRLNVAIRTARITADGHGLYGVGSGVVADSDAASEYSECLLKGRVLAELEDDYGLIETLALIRDPEGTTHLQRIGRHLDRLADSAAALGFRFDREAAAAQLGQLKATAGTDRRVRLELRRDGRLKVTDALLAPLADRPLRLVLHDQPVDRADPFLRRKTTRRGFWDAALARAQALGADDAICLNREGHLTEATRFNLFLRKDGRLLTPPLSDGLLPGVLRTELLESGAAIECRLTPGDLAQAEVILLGNSARGLLPCVMLPDMTGSDSGAQPEPEPAP